MPIHLCFWRPLYFIAKAIIHELDCQMSHKMLQVPVLMIVIVSICVDATGLSINGLGR